MILQTTSNNNAFDSSLTLSWGSDTTEGSTIVIAIGQLDTGGVNFISDDQSNSYTRVDGDTSSGAIAGEFWVAQGISGGTTPNITIFFNNSASCAAVAREYSDFIGLDINVMNVGFFGTPDSGDAGTTNYNDELLVGWTAILATGGLTAGTGYDNEYEDGDGLSLTVALEDRTITVAEDAQATFDNLSGAWLCGVAAFQITPSGVTVTKTQSAKARIANLKTKTQAAVARIANLKTKTQPSIARIATKPTKTQPAIGRIANIVTKTQAAKAAIQGIATKTQGAIARIANNKTKTQSAIARVANIVNKTQSAIARIATNPTKTQPAVGRISNIVTKTQGAVARVANLKTKTQSATANITVTGAFTKTQSAIARIASNLTKTQGAVARIVAILTKVQSATARISNTKTKTQGAISRVANNRTKTQPATANITTSTSGYAIDKVSESDPGFEDITAGSGACPFPTGHTIGYTIQITDALVIGTTYYWRVRGKDPLGSGAYGAWSEVRSFTVVSARTDNLGVILKSDDNNLVSSSDSNTIAVAGSSNSQSISGSAPGLPLASDSNNVNLENEVI